MQRDVGDIIDRYAIAKLKAERIGTEDNKKEYEAFLKEVELLSTKYPKYEWKAFIDLMVNINDFIWQLEAGLKSGKEKLKNPHYILDEDNKEALAKVGITAILNRNFNNIRVSFKNLINKLVNEGFQDCKQDHI